MTEEISDDGLATMVLGMMAGAVLLPEFPVWVEKVEEHRGEDGQVEWFDLVTRSGLRLRTTVEVVR